MKKEKKNSLFFLNEKFKTLCFLKGFNLVYYYWGVFMKEDNASSA